MPVPKLVAAARVSSAQRMRIAQLTEPDRSTEVRSWRIHSSAAPTTAWPKTEYQPSVPSRRGDVPQSRAPKQPSRSLRVARAMTEKSSATLIRWSASTDTKYGAGCVPKSSEDR